MPRMLMLPGLAALAAAVLLAAFAVLHVSAPARAGFVVTIDASPNTDTNLVGEDHTVTAVVTEGGPAQDWEVEFIILSGPNQGDSTIDVTDVNGEATFTYTGDGGTGTDQIEVCVGSFVGPAGISASGNGVPICENVEKTWVEPTPTPTPEPTATPAASATPTATPAEAAPAAELPDTGSQPPSDGGLPWSGVMILSLAGAALVGGGWALSRRTR